MERFQFVHGLHRENTKTLLTGGFACLRPRTEKKVAEELAGLNIPVYLPLVNMARMYPGTKVVTELPMIPSYIFLAVGDQERTSHKKAQRNSYILSFFANLTRKTR